MGIEDKFIGKTCQFFHSKTFFAGVNKIILHNITTLLSVTSDYEGQLSRGRGEGDKSPLILSLEVLVEVT